MEKLTSLVYEKPKVKQNWKTILLKQFLTVKTLKYTHSKDHQAILAGHSAQWQ